MSDSKAAGPVLIELDAAPEVSPAQAPLVEAAPRPAAAMERAVQVAARPGSRLGRWFWALLLALVGFVASVALWDFVAGLLARNALLGGAATILVAILALVTCALAVREAAGFARLRRIDGLRQAAAAASDVDAARAVAARVARFYRGRAEMDWALARFAERQGDVFDTGGHLALAEQVLLAPLDQAATREIEAAARQVATVTAVVPLAFADVAAALFANLRMIRRIAEIYGGRSGALGNWRLTRAVMAHLVATGAVAVGDDLIGSVAGGGLLGKLSRRFGEGVVNGALTARVGVAAMEVCRPLPFEAQAPPRVTGLVRRALTGLFSAAKDPE
ncbi:GTP-binding protein [Candidatus Rhodobacter oscarellae]|uniref:GTP-binding protein n=1 Tax=Candidatus Rhodobacter oscarellae TaxID=1675527 RepID=A0A0J9E3N5_9RHOB|nr:TIGR01620 family protein [Candidatus Rhodobacter lobularis]KMW56439.1 GTP-binding protein [Candidatus Rhodobacter lobularis]